jgi:hypothetical protein
VSVQITTYERSTLVNDEKYIGLDVHQATIVVAVMDSTGKLVMESILETKAARFNFRGYSIFLNLLPQTFKMDGQSNLWYRQVTHKWQVHNRLSHVVSINGW